MLSILTVQYLNVQLHDVSSSHLVLAAIIPPTPTAAATPTSQPAPTPTAVPKPTPTNSAPTPTPTPKLGSPTATPTPKPNSTPTPTPKPASPTATPTPKPNVSTPTPTVTPTPMIDSVPTDTPAVDTSSNTLPVDTSAQDTVTYDTSGDTTSVDSQNSQAANGIAPTPVSTGVPIKKQTSQFVGTQPNVSISQVQQGPIEKPLVLLTPVVRKLDFTSIQAASLSAKQAVTQKRTNESLQRIVHLFNIIFTPQIIWF